MVFRPTMKVPDRGNKCMSCTRIVVVFAFVFTLVSQMSSNASEPA
jgi:hypothetical protein